MKTVKTIADLRHIVNQWRQQGSSIAFVPTMGHLHAGHIKLVSTARQQADKVVVSIFVNPTQFGQGEDYSTYPRTEQRDAEKLQAVNADLLFLPGVEEIYPQALLVNVTVTGISDLHCGQSRPGHFNGVASVVCKLFNIVQPDMAFFGEKDFQQLAVIRQMVADLNFSIQIHGVPIVREPDGLAMSSRNSYLTPQQRTVAPKLYQSICQVRDAVLAAQSDYSLIIKQQLESLQGVGFQPDYLVICRSGDLLEATEDDRNLVILVAAWLGNTRLIDNLCFSK